MVEKAKTSTLISQLAKECGIKHSEATLFFNTFQTLFEDALVNDNILKINNIGTFKIEQTKPRKSIDVNTGETIEIAPYRRLTFTPAASLADAVNAGLAHLTTYNLDAHSDTQTPSPTATSAAPVTTIDDLPTTLDLSGMRLTQPEPTNAQPDPTTEQPTEGQTPYYDTDTPYPLSDNTPLRKLTEDAIGLRSLLDELQSLDKHTHTPETAETTDTTDTTAEPVEYTTQPEPAATEPITRPSANQPENEKEHQQIDMTNKNEQSTTQTTENQSTYIDGAAAVAAVNRENDTGISGSKAVWISIAVVLALLIIGIVIWQNLDFFKAPATPAETEIMANAAPATPDDLTPETPGTIQPILPADTAEKVEANGPIEEYIEENATSNAQTDGIPQDATPTETQPQAAQHQTTQPQANQPQAPQPKTSGNGFSKEFNRPRHYTTFIDTVTIKPGSRLTLIAQDYYGMKDFWVYIYEANRDIISNPNNVKAGMQIRIPQLSHSLINSKNEECIRYARYLKDQYVK